MKPVEWRKGGCFYSERAVVVYLLFIHLHSFYPVKGHGGGQSRFQAEDTAWTRRRSHQNATKRDEQQFTLPAGGI